MNELDYIHYALDDTPVEATWLRLELPYPNGDNPAAIAGGRRMNRMDRLSYTKALMAHLDFKINVDFKLDSNYHRDKMVMFLAPNAKEYASWIRLNWNPR